jgi:hypothetical protein
MSKADADPTIPRDTADLPVALTPLAAVAWIATRCVALTLAAGPGGSIRSLLWLGLKWRESQPREKQDRWVGEHARYAMERAEWDKWAAEPERWKRPLKSASKAMKEALRAERRALTEAWAAREPTVTPADVPDPFGAALAQLDVSARAGRVPASAMRDGYRQVIPPEVWPELTVAEVKVGRLEVLDVCALISTGPTRRPCEWTQALFDRDALVHLYPAPDGAAAAATIAGEKRLQAWLEDRMRASPAAPAAKSVTRTQAEQAGHNFSGAGFDRAWREAVKATGATAWSHAGTRNRRA